MKVQVYGRTNMWTNAYPVQKLNSLVKLPHLHLTDVQRLLPIAGGLHLVFFLIGLTIVAQSWYEQGQSICS